MTEQSPVVMNLSVNNDIIFKRKLFNLLSVNADAFFEQKMIVFTTKVSVSSVKLFVTWFLKHIQEQMFHFSMSSNLEF